MIMDTSARTILLCGSLLSLLPSVMSSSLFSPVPREFCERETYRAECSAPDEVILMNRAVYGRMRMGRCVTKDRGSLGCHKDVLPRLDMICSGRRECSLEISDLHEMYNIRPCPQDLMSYLEASYTCVKATQCSSTPCDGGGFLKVMSPSGYLASIVTAENGCGGAPCPWVIQPHHGQRMNLTFYTFVELTRDQINNHYCHHFATVMDKKTKVPRDITVCDEGAVRRTFNFMTSPSADVEIRVFGSTEQNSHGHFIMKYEAVGCPDIEAPPGGWMLRDGHQLTVGCNVTRQRSHLTCNGTVWVGKIEACHVTEGPPPEWTLSDALEDAGLLVVVAIGVALGVILGFLMLAVAIVYMRRKQRRSQYERAGVLISQTPPGHGSPGCKLYERSPHLSEKLSMDDNSFYRTYQSRGSIRQDSRPRPMMTSVAVPEPPLTSCPLQGHLDSSNMATMKIRDHVYESPHFTGPAIPGQQIPQTMSPSKQNVPT